MIPGNRLVTVAGLKRRAILENHPALGFVPNIGQERAFKPYRHDVPYITVFGGGNGVGKTATLAIMAVGLCFGTSELNEFFDDYTLFSWMKERCSSRGRPARGRIVCHADSMKENGSVLQAIQEWFPKGRYKLNKHGKAYYSEIACDTGVTIDIKTHDQDTVAVSGTTLDFILADEPFPRALWSETVGRTRSGGIIGFFLTPLQMAGWMMDQIVDVADDKEIVVTNASIWDNCKDIPGTRGHLSRDHIDRMIRAWERESPDEVEARVKGLFTHLSGAMYKIFSPEVHVIQPFPIPPEWPIYHIIDPHDARPPATCWIAQGPHASVAFKEWPNLDYTKIKTSTHTISQVCDEMRRIENNFRPQVTQRLMDPNKAEYEYPNTKLTVKQEYARRGFSFRPSDDHLDLGHKAVNEMLHYDAKKPVDEYNSPAFYVTDDCTNIKKALQKYGLKKTFNEGGSLTSKMDQTYKDFADLIRYFAIKRQPYEAVNTGAGYWDLIRSGRIG